MIVIRNTKENMYLLLIPNITNGYNYFEIYIDKENKLIHLFDSLESRKTGTSAINSVNYIVEIKEALNLDYELLIYYPEFTINKACITSYNEKDGFSKWNNNNIYKPFLKKAELFLENKF